LDGFCAFGAVFLFDALREKGLTPKLAVAEDDDDSGHCFVLCEGHVVDVTATQFGKEAVEIVPVARVSESEWFWVPQRLFSATTEFVDFLDEAEWPEYQIPYDYARQNSMELVA
jgi:hypothetical protein